MVSVYPAENKFPLEFKFSYVTNGKVTNFIFRKFDQSEPGH